MVFSAGQILRAADVGFRFTNVASQAGLRSKTIFGGEKNNRFLLETTGCGIAFVDYDNDGWLDIFVVNGSRLEAAFPPDEVPVSRLYKNNRDGTFTDVTVKAGVARTGWGQGVCVGDYNNDGFEDILVTYWGGIALWRNNGDGTFTDVAQQAGLLPQPGGVNRWNTGCAFLDYDRDGHLDLFIANYIEFEQSRMPTPESGACIYKGLKVACGPPGLPGGKNLLYRNRGDGTFADVSKDAGILDTPGTYGLGVVVSDFDNDGWPDIYVANDSAPSALYFNQHNGTFREMAIEAGAAYSPDGKSQAGMGVSAGDYDGDGLVDIVKTNFAGDTSSLYRNLGQRIFEDMTFQSGLGRNTRFLGWGAGFADFDNDGRLDIFLANGHVYPEVSDNLMEYGYKQRKVVYRNAGGGRFEDVSEAVGPGALERVAARGCAFGDFDNDGDIDVVVNCNNDVPQLLRCDCLTGNNWIKVKTVGVRSNRSGIGTRVVCRTPDGLVQSSEVQSGGSYISQNDLRVHFGLGRSESCSLEVRWPSGIIDRLDSVRARSIVTIREGEGSRGAALKGGGGLNPD